MNFNNRLEDTWTPSWDLGLQDEFSFFSENSSEDGPAPAPSVGAARSVAAGQAVLEQETYSRRLDVGAASVGELISYFESLYSEEISSHG